MRITIDQDSKAVLSLSLKIVRGFLLFKKLPRTIRKTTKGYHLIWSGIDISERDMFKYRKMLGDDKNRIRLDMLSDKRLNQVLFSAKRITYFNADGTVKQVMSRGDWA